MSGHCHCSSPDKSQSWMLNYSIPGRWPLAGLLAHCPRSVADHLISYLLFLLTSQTSFAWFCKIIGIHRHRIHLALSKFSNVSQIWQLNKTSATAVPLCRGQSRSGLNQFYPQKMHQHFFSRNPATHTFFPLQNVLMLGCPSLSVNYINMSLVSFRLIGTLHWVPSM